MLHDAQVDMTGVSSVQLILDNVQVAADAPLWCDAQ
jgi:hypothetical protein